MFSKAFAHPCTIDAELRENGTMINDVKFIGVQNCVIQEGTDTPFWIEYLNSIVEFFQGLVF